MAQPKPLQLHPKRFLAAATIASTALVAVLVAELATDLAIPAAVLGTARAACMTLWVLWFVAYGLTALVQYIGRDSTAYAIGYVEGVTGRYPNADTADLARIKRER